MLELYVVKATRTVPRRERGGNPSDLADRETSTVLRGERSRKAPYLLDPIFNSLFYITLTTRSIFFLLL